MVKKSKIWFWGMAALMLTLSMVIVACDPGTGGDNTGGGGTKGDSNPFSGTSWINTAMETVYFSADKVTLNIPSLSISATASYTYSGNTAIIDGVDKAVISGNQLTLTLSELNGQSFLFKKQ